MKNITFNTLKTVFIIIYAIPFVVSIFWVMSLFLSVGFVLLVPYFIFAGLNYGVLGVIVLGTIANTLLFCTFLSGDLIENAEIMNNSGDMIYVVFGEIFLFVVILFIFRLSEVNGFGF